MVASGELVLPCEAALRARALEDQNKWEARFGYDSRRVKGLVDFQLYCDDLAAEMGCLPPLGTLFLRSPRLWLKIMFSAFSMHQYRLVGPRANPEAAAKVRQGWLQAAVATTTPLFVLLDDTFFFFVLDDAF